MAQGDQVYVFRELLKLEGIYEHHGIDCGDGTVIHYRKPSEIIERTPLEVFTRGNPVYKREYLKGFAFLPEIVVHRAISRLGENKYNLLFNNCEHFATWCKTGISESKQVREFVPVISKLKTEKLTQPIAEALGGTDHNNAQQLLDQALGDIKTIWEQIQPKYKEALAESQTWQRVALEALKKEREDLAREALKRKLDHQQTAEELQARLAQLADMTETLLRNTRQL